MAGELSPLVAILDRVVGAVDPAQGDRLTEHFLLQAELARAQQEGEAVADPNVLRPGTNRLDRGAARQHRADVEARLWLLRNPQQRRLGRRQAGADELAHVAEDQLQLGPRCEGGELALDLVRLPEVVGIEKGDELAAGDSERRVARRPDAGARLGNHLDFRAVAGGNRGAAVARAVVDDNHLVAGASLGQHALDRLGEVGLTVADWDCRGDGRLSQVRSPGDRPWPR